MVIDRMTWGGGVVTINKGIFYPYISSINSIIYQRYVYNSTLVIRFRPYIGQYAEKLHTTSTAVGVLK